MSNKFMIHAEHHHDDTDCYTSIILNNDPNLEMLVKLMATEIFTDSSYNGRHQVAPPSDYGLDTIYILPPCSQHIIHQWCNEYHYVDPQIMIQQYDCCNPELKPGDFEHC